MTATNHAMTGAIIGLSVHQPVLALALALLSHYILDALPHFGTGLSEKRALKSNFFVQYLMVEAWLCFLVVLFLGVAQPRHWLLAAICAFVAASPDLLSINRFLTVRKGKVYRPNAYSQFASAIQWFERPIGAVVEVAWAAGCIVILAKLV